MINRQNESGISAVELLVTLFVAFMIVYTGYLLYGVIMRDGGEAHSTSELSTTASFHLKKTVNSITASTAPNCSLTPPEAPIVTTFDENGIHTEVSVSCPKQSLADVVLITSISSHEDSEVAHAQYKHL